ncbi:MAG: helix-turn-helix transcriptional regulator [Williamsia sp.]|nr:helix-turn-helix transcriptional regulator [Williamsia sp.]
MDNDLAYKFVRPDKALADFVESFWLLQNHSDMDKEVVVLPDGRIDLFLSLSATEPFHVTLLGIGTQPDKTTVLAQTVVFAISFRLLAAEYIFHTSFSNLVDKATHLPVNFWGFSAADITDFEAFCRKASQKIQEHLNKETDSRKRKLFDLVYSSQGSMTVKELAEKAFWSSRQINRYFNQQFGISLKTYCSILRFRASFQHIKEGKLFPDQNFADQSHFIREIKKLSGALPKELSQNKNDRFIQFWALSKK